MVESGAAKPNSFLWHAYILRESLREWRWYLNYLEEELKQIVSTALISYGTFMSEPNHRSLRR